MPVTIVDDVEILDNAAIIAENFNIGNLTPQIETQFGALQWCARRRLIKNTTNCTTCNSPAAIIKYTKGNDGYRWSCYRHNFTKSVRNASFFGKSLAVAKTNLVGVHVGQELPTTTD